MENTENILNSKEKRNYPRDVFLHLLSIITLYWSAVSLITLLWQFVNYYLPDSLLRVNYYAGPLRVAVASLIIVFPVFILVTWYLNKIYRRNIELRNFKLRKWLIYFTLFVASIVIIIDLVRVVFVYLSGEITSSFILKALSVFLVAFVVFWYYLDDVRKDMPSKNAKYLAWATCIVMTGLILSSFFIIGSPQEERLKRFDQEKISDLMEIQWQIVNYYQGKEKLPESLDVLKDNISGFSIPKDPQTGEDYDYNITDAEQLSFELCAEFNRSGSEDRNMIAYPISKSANDYWNHQSGRTCFQRQIDKDLYPPLKDLN